jgi:flagellum-specific peptidoglycan hydrolase FlgJ
MASCCRRIALSDGHGGGPDPDRFADALTGVYATDPQYGTTLKWVMDNYQLKQYDTKA